jgi:hypothetical protein
MKPRTKLGNKCACLIGDFCTSAFNTDPNEGKGKCRQTYCPSYRKNDYFVKTSPCSIKVVKYNKFRFSLDLFAALYNHPTLSKIAILHGLALTNKDYLYLVDAAISAGKSKQRGKGRRGTPMKSMGVDLDYGNRPIKNALEAEEANLIDLKGGIFGLFGTELKSHIEKFGGIPTIYSPITVIEQDKDKYIKMCRIANELVNENINVNKLRISQGDLFDVLKRIPKQRIPMNRFGHLDFCITAHRMLRDMNLEENLKWLAGWHNIKKTFFMDITFATRNDIGNKHIVVMEDMIPSIFSKAGWKVSSPMKHRANTGGNFIVKYRDAQSPLPMVRAFYKFEK